MQLASPPKKKPHHSKWDDTGEAGAFWAGVANGVTSLSGDKQISDSLHVPTPDCGADWQGCQIANFDGQLAPGLAAAVLDPAALADDLPDASLVFAREVTEAGTDAGVTGSRQVTVLGRFKGGVDSYVGKPGFNTLNLPKTGTGRWYWSRNKAFIDDAIERGDEIRLVTDPTKPLYQGGNTYQLELRYLRDRGYTFQPYDDYWIAVPGQ